VVYVRRESPVIRFCAIVARNGSINVLNDVVELMEVCIMQASRSSVEAVRLIRRL